jgi:hypothetical protein
MRAPHRRLSPGGAEALLFKDQKNAGIERASSYISLPLRRNTERVRVEFLHEMDLMMDQALGCLDLPRCVGAGRSMGADTLHNCRGLGASFSAIGRA